VSSLRSPAPAASQSGARSGSLFALSLSRSILFLAASVPARFRHGLQFLPAASASSLSSSTEQWTPARPELPECVSFVSFLMRACSVSPCALETGRRCLAFLPHVLRVSSAFVIRSPCFGTRGRELSAHAPGVLLPSAKFCSSVGLFCAECLQVITGIVFESRIRGSNRFLW
jgi:hypothetical protein